MVNPVLVEVTRGGIVESRHRGTVAVSLASGETVLALGDASAEIFPRSSAKPFQALAFVAADGGRDLDLADEEVAVLCASHNGEAKHVATVRGVLARIGLGEDALECGPAWPLDAAIARALASEGGKADAIHHPCSGKHAGMLALARHMGVDHHGYVRPDHPVQRRIAEVLEAVCGAPIGRAPCGTDGCSVPTWAIPASALALAYARLAGGGGLAPDLAAGAKRIREAMAVAPFMVAGSGRFCTEMMEAARGRAIVKTGAEGVMCAGLPGRGLGLAVKCDDGAARGAEVVIANLLVAFGAADAGDPAVTRLVTRPIVNPNRIHTGDIRTSGELTDALARRAVSMTA